MIQVILEKIHERNSVGEKVVMVNISVHPQKVDRSSSTIATITKTESLVMTTELAFTEGGWLHPDQMPHISSLGAWDAMHNGDAFKNPCFSQFIVYGRYEVTHAT